MNINKTHIWNVTYMGICIYDEIMQYKDTVNIFLNAICNEKSVDYKGKALADFGLFADAFKGAALKQVFKDVTTISNQSYLGIEIYTSVMANIKHHISGTVYIQNPELLKAIHAGTFEYYGGKMSSRQCNPTMNKWANQVLEDMHEQLESERIQWAESHIGNFEYANPEAVFEGDSGIKKPVVPFIQPKAKYYWDAKGRMAYDDDAINTNYKRNSEDCDPENGKAIEYNLLNTIARNKKAQQAGAFPKDSCLACGETFDRKSNRQQYCTSCKKTVDNLQNKEKKEQNRRLKTTNGTVPSLDQSFERYARTAWIGMANGQPLNKKSITRGTLIKTPEPILKGTKPEAAHREPCECGCTEIASYKPWKPEGNAYGKIGSTVLYCPQCGLVIDNKPIKSQSEKGNNGYMGD